MLHYTQHPASRLLQLEDTMGVPPLRLRALVYPEANEWVAHCLELDLVETAESPDAALDALLEAVQTQVTYAEAHDNGAALFHPAPAEAWSRFGRLLRPRKTINDGV